MNARNWTVLKVRGKGDMKYKLTIFPALEAGPFQSLHFFETLEEMKAAANTTSDTLLFLQGKMKAMSDYSNAFIEEKLVDGDWVEIDD